MACEQVQLPGRSYPDNAHGFTSSGSFAAIRNEVNLLPFRGRAARSGATTRRLAANPQRHSRGPRRLSERPPGIKRPCVLRLTAHPRIRRARPEPLLSPLPDLIGPHAPHTAGCLQLSYRRRQMTASPLQPAAHRSRSFAAAPAASSRSRRIPATDKIVIPAAAGQRPPRSVSSTRTGAGNPSGSITISHTPPLRRYAEITGTRRPASGCRGFVSSTSAGSQSKPRSV